MGTTSSFFGGGGGGAVLDAPNQNLVNTIDFAANTQFAVGGGGRGLTARVIPCKANTFFLLEGNATSKVYVSYWSLDDSGAATQLAAAIKVNTNANQVWGASSNGIDRLMVLTFESNNYQRLRNIYYNGSTLSSSNVTDYSTANYRSTSTITCTSDGMLLGCIGYTSGNNQVLKCGAIRPDGTTLVAQHTSSFHNEHGRLIGTADGIIGCSRQTNQARTARVEKVYINTANTSALSAIAHANNTVELQSAQLTSANNPPYIIPTKGGAYAVMMSGEGYLHEFSLISHGVQVNIVPTTNNSPYLSRVVNGTSATLLNRSLDTGSTFCRQSNGTYQHYLEQNSSQYVTFDPVNHSHHSPFGTIRAVGDAGSSGCSGAISTAIVGKFVIGTWADTTNGEVNIDAWNYRG